MPRNQHITMKNKFWIPAIIIPFAFAACGEVEVEEVETSTEETVEEVVENIEEAAEATEQAVEEAINEVEEAAEDEEETPAEEGTIE